MAQQETLTTQGEEGKKRTVKKRKNSEAERERERNSQQKHFLLQRDEMCVEVCVCVCVCACYSVCGHARAAIGWGTCTMLALLILNLEQSGKYTPSP